MEEAPQIARDDFYEPPQIEAVLSPEELTREIFYAGDLPSICADDCQ